MSDPIVKPSGVTPTEKQLSSLCERTFLSLWSYPNPYRDCSSGPNKEVCDLLVVCGDDVIIFSDKECELADSGDLLLDWKRWYRRAVIKSADQIYGAERTLRTYPDRIFVDSNCQTRLPPVLPPESGMRIHRVVVARGASKGCRRHCGGSGSLKLTPNAATPEEVPPPFCIGDPFPDRGFTHILDDVSLQLILDELDTVTDFLDYLNEKERFIRAGLLSASPGEEHLLAWYMQHMDADDSRHGLVCPDPTKPLTLNDDTWPDFASGRSYAARFQANRASYAWDELINVFGRHALGGTMITHGQYSISDMESGLRIMAKEPRLARRALASGMIEAFHVENGDTAFVRTIRSSERMDLAYVFAFCPKRDDAEQIYCEKRRNYLRDYCIVLAWIHRDIKTVVGIATECKADGENRSHDMIVWDAPPWDEANCELARTVQEHRGFLSRNPVKAWQRTDDEFPLDLEDQITSIQHDHTKSESRNRRVGRNEPCPCGSGMKYKKCCLE